MVPGKDNSAEDLVALSDQALYEAKENGRGQVSVSNIRVVSKSKKKLKQ